MLLAALLAALVQAGCGPDATLRADATEVPGAAAPAPGPKVQSNDQVEYFGLLEVHTGPWEAKPPVKGGTVVFNLHRFDEQGRQTLSGAWKIDVLIPQ